MSRVAFLVDGFNLYHSIIDIGRDFAGLGVKWLDIRLLCSSYLHLLGHSAKLEKIYYFSAFATHLNDPSVINRHSFPKKHQYRIKLPICNDDINLKGNEDVYINILDLGYTR